MRTVLHAGVQMPLAASGRVGVGTLPLALGGDAAPAGAAPTSASAAMTAVKHLFMRHNTSFRARPTGSLFDKPALDTSAYSLKRRKGRTGCGSRGAQVSRPRRVYSFEGFRDGQGGGSQRRSQESKGRRVTAPPFSYPRRFRRVTCSEICRAP